MPAPRKYPQELRERAIRLVAEAREEPPGDTTAALHDTRSVSGLSEVAGEVLLLEDRKIPSRGPRKDMRRGDSQHAGDGL